MQDQWVGGTAKSVAIGDVTGDGRDDAVIVTAVGSTPDSSVDCKVTVFQQQEDGSLALQWKYTYHPQCGVSYQHLIALGDLNRDGIEDMVIGHPNGISTLLSRRGEAPQLSHWTISQEWGAVLRLKVMDMNGDNRMDVIALSEWGGTRTYYGDGTGSFRRVEATAYFPMLSGDLNSDGSADLVLPSAGNLVEIVHYEAGHGYTGTPITVDPGYAGWSIGGVAIGDFNGDGRKDLATSRSANSPTVASIFYQQADGQLAAPVHVGSFDLPGTMLGTDLDGNGTDDLLVVHNGSNKLGYYLRFDQEQFTEAQIWPIDNLYTYSIATGDLNGDGCTDVALANQTYSALIWAHGQGCTSRPDLGIALAGNASAVSVGLSNSPGTESIQSPLVQVDLSVRTGTLQTGDLPAGCVIQSQAARSQRIECLVDTLPSDATTTLTIPVSFSGTGPGGALTATAQAQTDTNEKTLENNRASLKVMQQTAAGLTPRQRNQKAGKPSGPGLLRVPAGSQRPR